MITIEEFKNIVKTEPNDKEFKKFNKRVYIYRGVLVDYNYDVSDATNDIFDPYFDEGYVRMVGDKIDYIRPHIVLDFKNDVQKYKDEIIKYIDNKI